MEKKDIKKRIGEKVVAVATAVSLVAGGPADPARTLEDREDFLQPKAITEIYMPPTEPDLSEPEEEKKRVREITSGKKMLLIAASALVYIVLMAVLSTVLASLPIIAAGAVKIAAGIVLSTLLSLLLLKIFNPDKSVAEILKSGKPLKAVFIFSAVLALCIGGRILLTKIEIPSFVELVIPAAVMAACLGAFAGRKKS